MQYICSSAHSFIIPVMNAFGLAASCAIILEVAAAAATAAAGGRPVGTWLLGGPYYTAKGNKIISFKFKNILVTPYQVLPINFFVLVSTTTTFSLGSCT